MWETVNKNRGAVFILFWRHLKILVAKGDIEQVPYWGPTNIRQRRKKFSRYDDMAPGICASLNKYMEQFKNFLSHDFKYVQITILQTLLL
jgi:hypothetical protein